MPAIFADSGKLAALRNHAERGDEMSSALMALLANTYYVAMTASAEVSNAITISGQVTDQDGTPLAGVKGVLLKSKPMSGAGTLAVVSAHGTAKAGSSSTELWLETLADGSFQVTVTNVIAEDNLVVAQLDNGTTEMLKLTFA